MTIQSVVVPIHSLLIFHPSETAMKLVKYHGKINTKFDNNTILKIKNTDTIEDGEKTAIVAKTPSTTYVFQDDESCINIAHDVSDGVFEKEAVVGLIKSSVDHRYKFECIDLCFMFHSQVDLGHGGPELLHWLLTKDQREDVVSNIYDPEIHDAMVVKFELFNNIRITSHVFTDGRVVHMCEPDKKIDIELVRIEASGIDEIFDNIIRMN